MNYHHVFAFQCHPATSEVRALDDEGDEARHSLKATSCLLELSVLEISRTLAFVKRRLWYAYLQDDGMFVLDIHAARRNSHGLSYRRLRAVKEGPTLTFLRTRPTPSSSWPPWQNITKALSISEMTGSYALSTLTGRSSST